MASSETKKKSSRLPACLLLVVLGFVLFAMIGPSWSMQSAHKMARKNAAGGAARQIVLAYITYTQGSGKTRIVDFGHEPKKGQASSPAQFAEILARYAGLTSGDMWYIESDEALDAKNIPMNVLSQIDYGENNLTLVKPISWAVVINVPKERWGDSKYPVMWTRGLREDGTWTKDSPWSGEGGHIVFADSSMRWYDNLNLEGNHLAKFTERTETSNFRDAIGPDAVVLEDKVEDKK